jgi:hypothetical protein
LFDGNHVTVFDLHIDDIIPVEYTLEVGHYAKYLDSNPDIPNLLCFKNEQEYFVVNLTNMKIISSGRGLFWWKGFG